MRKGLIALALLLVFGYGLFEARRLLQGPDIQVLSPRPGSATSSVVVTIEGTAENISFLTINDAVAYTDESGKFVYRYAPPAGYTEILVAATDRFGRSARVRVPFTVITYCPAQS